MNYFSSDKMTGTHEDRRCSHCDTQPKLVYQMLDSRSGKTIRMFECKCGERGWDQEGRPANGPSSGGESGAI